MHHRDDLEPGRGPSTLVALCAAASLGLLFVQTSTLLQGLAPLGSMPVAIYLDVALYVSVAVPLLALVAWHLFPRRAWAALLVAGALCSLPVAVLSFVPVSYARWMDVPVAVLTTSAPPFTLVGVLGAATMIWQAGRPALGATLSGAAVVVQFAGPVIMFSLDGFVYLAAPSHGLLVLGLVLKLLALAGAVVAVIVAVRRSGEPVARPRWQVTLPAGLVAFAPLLAYHFQPTLFTDAVESSSDSAEAIADYYLYIGLTFLAVGVVAGAVAGRHALLGSAAAGLMLGAFGMLVIPSLAELRDMPVLTMVATLGSLLVGLFAGLSRWRAQIGMFGIGVVAIGLVILSYLFNSDAEYSSYADFTRVATPVLLVVGVIASLGAFAGIGAAHAATSETPAVLGVLPTAFALGTITITAHFGITVGSGRTPSAGVLPAAAGALLLAALLVGMIAASGRAGAPEGR